MRHYLLTSPIRPILKPKPHCLANAALFFPPSPVFETELVAVKGVPKPESIKTKSTEAPAAASETASSAASGVAGKIAEKVGDAAKVAETVLADTDSDGQEHNEL